MSIRFQRKLKALQYADWAQFDIKSIDGIKELVSWLESNKIRALSVEERKSIRNTKSSHWYSYFSSYLESNETCPYRCKSDINKMELNDWIEIIEWLICQAIQCEYDEEENRIEYNRRQPIRRRQKKEYILSECETKECSEALDQLCKFLKVPHNEDNVITSEALNTLISTKFNELALTNYETSLQEKKLLENDVIDPFDHIKTYKDILKYYSHYEGFSTGDEKIDAAAIILRILYIFELRGMQNQLNEIVTFIQRFTANPKTNTKLGKVGY